MCSSDLEDHGRLAAKGSRVLTRDQVETLLELPSFQSLLSLKPAARYGPVINSCNDIEDRPQVYSRLVRPGMARDVGSPHCDYWFDVAQKTGFGKGNTWKIWAPICIEPGLNGLLFYPHAPDDLPFNVVPSPAGEPYPRLQGDISQLGPSVLSEPHRGEVVLFRDDVVHCGALNEGLSIRVSIEVTLVIPAA